MARTSRLFTYILLILMIILIGFGAFYLYNKYGRRASSPVAAVPIGTGVFFKLNEPGKLLHDLSSGNEIWADLVSTQDGIAFLEKIQAVDSLSTALGYAEWFEGVGIALAVFLATFVATYSEFKNEESFQKDVLQVLMLWKQ